MNFIDELEYLQGLDNEEFARWVLAHSSDSLADGDVVSYDLNMAGERVTIYVYQDDETIYNCLVDDLDLDLAYGYYDNFIGYLMDKYRYSQAEAFWFSIGRLDRISEFKNLSSQAMFNLLFDEEKKFQENQENIGYEIKRYYYMYRDKVNLNHIENSRSDIVRQLKSYKLQYAL